MNKLGKYKFQWWHLLIVLGVIYIFNNGNTFLGAVTPGCISKEPSSINEYNLNDLSTITGGLCQNSRYAASPTPPLYAHFCNGNYCSQGTVDFQTSDQTYNSGWIAYTRVCGNDLKAYGITNGVSRCNDLGACSGEDGVATCNNDIGNPILESLPGELNSEGDGNIKLYNWGDVGYAVCEDDKDGLGWVISVYYSGSGYNTIGRCGVTDSPNLIIICGSDKSADDEQLLITDEGYPESSTQPYISYGGQDIRVGQSGTKYSGLLLTFNENQEAITIITNKESIIKKYIDTYISCPETLSCIQVVTSACNLLTGEIRNFPTPCDIPNGWTKDLNQCEKAPICGDGIIGYGLELKTSTTSVVTKESCDGINMGGESCVALGYDGGILKCKPDCTFDMSGCALTPPQLGTKFCWIPTISSDKEKLAVCKRIAVPTEDSCDYNSEMDCQSNLYNTGFARIINTILEIIRQILAAFGIKI